MQAFVITAYKDYEALKTLTLALSRRGLCVIHADAQGAVTARQVDELNALPNVRAIRKYKVNWGSVCHLYALLDLCRMALEDERVDYLHLMSAQDVPLLCADEMERRFAGETRLFMQRLSTAENPELAHRYEHYHFMHWLNYRDPSERTQNWVGRIDRWQDRPPSSRTGGSGSSARESSSSIPRPLTTRRSTPSPAARGRSCCAGSARRISRRNSIFRMCFPARRLSRGSSTGSCIFPSGTSRSAACPPC